MCGKDCNRSFTSAEIEFSSHDFGSNSGFSKIEFLFGGADGNLSGAVGKGAKNCLE